MSTLTEFLDRRFQEAHPLADTDAKKAKFLEVDAGSYSKILSGKMELSASRAAKWAEQLFPSDLTKQDQFRNHVLTLAQTRVRTVAEFCDSISETGAVPVTQISELFRALLNKSDVKHALICAEYRDLPRAGESAKYESLGDDLADAIANGLTFAMFQPFTDAMFKPFTEVPPKLQKSEEPSAADKYMQEMRVKCREAYRKFRLEAEKIATANKIKEMGGAPLDDQQVKDIRAVIDKRLRLYERNVAAFQSPAVGGFQAKIFLVHYKTRVPVEENHYRIIQWVATQKHDLLIYRGDTNLKSEALKDTFYPVPHYFELHDGALPLLKDSEDMVDTHRAIFAKSVRRQELPQMHNAWKAFEEKWEP